MSYTLEGWQHGTGTSTIDLSGMLCTLCGHDLGVIRQCDLTGMDLYKCGEYNYSQMAHSACVAFEELFDAYTAEHGYDWFYKPTRERLEKEKV